MFRPKEGDGPSLWKQVFCGLKNNDLQELWAHVKVKAVWVVIYEALLFLLFGWDIVWVGSLFPTVAVVPAGDAFLSDLMGEFPFEVCFLYDSAAEVQGRLYS